ncbi:aminotransferase class IV [Porphyromonas pogonae]|uniref:aminotransferase class IV n=1 Tax=Porphyromonas pogonae TaxID=867595 RepID=UPI002E77FA07|nr:aminotransferase class IV [Porphyromonas pogonae]
MKDLFIETIRVRDKNTVELRDLHQERMVRTGKYLHWREVPAIPNLLEICPNDIEGDNIKCKITYHEKGISDISFTKYVKRKIDTLRIVVDNEIHYSLKSADRAELEKITHILNENEEAIIVRNGLLTDTTYSNLIIEIAGKLITPSRPLLEGVQRQHLISTGQIVCKDLTVDDLKIADRIFLINAMMPLEDCIGLERNSIIL